MVDLLLLAVHRLGAGELGVGHGLEAVDRLLDADGEAVPASEEDGEPLVHGHVRAASRGAARRPWRPLRVAPGPGVPRVDDTVGDLLGGGDPRANPYEDGVLGLIVRVLEEGEEVLVGQLHLLKLLVHRGDETINSRVADADGRVGRSTGVGQLLNHGVEKPDLGGALLASAR